ncbi:MAG: putative heptosyltransferase, Glycosyltransferase Family 9 [Ramlibacter sp.]|nr:putative heptosyltransferase, Glycosyltransferase Family 9 [Ramlibacter sp.]
MKILIVKLSSLGDVVHTMPAVQDIRRALPDAQVHWVVEQSFVPLVQRCEGVHEVIGCELRRWRKSPLGTHTRSAWRQFSMELRGNAYDAVIDLQGLTKSALVARAARVTEGGKRYALANRTEGSGWEAPTRWLADVAIAIAPRAHAVTRSRELCAQALQYSVPLELRYGLRADAHDLAAPGGFPCVAFVHGTSREDKCWPQEHWIELGRRLIAQGFRIGLPHGDASELARAQAIAQALGPQAQVWERLDLGRMVDRLAACAGVIGVDSGLSHVAVALDLPHVQIYNFETAWRTGPIERERQLAVYAQPTPSVDAVWQGWRDVMPSSR